MALVSNLILFGGSYSDRNFLLAATSEKIHLKVTVTVKRKREVDLVVPVSFSAITKCNKTAVSLDEELQRRKNKWTHF